MNEVNNKPELITAREAAELSYKFGTIDDIERAKNIFEEFTALECYERNTQWIFYCALAAVYSAGRIQGIREERAKRKD